MEAASFLDKEEALFALDDAPVVVVCLFSLIQTDSRRIVEAFQVVEHQMDLTPDDSRRNSSESMYLNTTYFEQKKRYTLMLT